jgi:hypothetical protein
VVLEAVEMALLKHLRLQRLEPRILAAVAVVLMELKLYLLAQAALA